ncbi:MAG: hypothetical protein GY854_33760 [Deltaproteobacteria bacterium]|nr:hypothetical protein [Deltaproteobacteria bacterium]
MEAGFTGHLYLNGMTGSERHARPGAGPLLAVGVTDWLAIEGSGEWSHDRALSGNGALRFTLEGEEGKDRSFNSDLTLGGGGGRGGVLCDNDNNPRAVGFGEMSDIKSCPDDKQWDNLSWIERPYYGGFVDVGFGGPSGEMLTPFIHLTFELTDGDGTPITFWFHIRAGLNIDWNDRLHLFFGGGISGYQNETDPLINGSSFWEAVMDNNFLLLLQIGLVVEIDFVPNPPNEKRRSSDIRAGRINLTHPQNGVRRVRGHDPPYDI